MKRRALRPACGWLWLACAGAAVAFADATLDIDGQPAGAKIYVDGYLRAALPATVRVPSVSGYPELHRVTVTAEGCERLDRLIAVRTADKRQLDIRLPELRNLTALLPDGAQVVSHRALNCDGDPELELAIVYATRAAEEGQLQHHLVVLDHDPQAPQELCRVADLGPTPPTLDTPCDLDRDGADDIIVRGRRDDRAYALAVVSGLGGGGVRSLGRVTWAGDSPPPRIRDVNHDGSPEYLVRLGEQTEDGLTAHRWGLAHFDGHGFTVQSVPGDPPLRPRVMALPRFGLRTPAAAARRGTRITLTPTPMGDVEAPVAGGLARCGWNDDALLFYFNAPDEEYEQPGRGSSLVQGDHLLVCFDTRLRDDFGVTKRDSDDATIAVSAGDFRGLGPEAVRQTPTIEPVANVGLDSKRTDNGYSLLLELPFSAIGVSQPDDVAAMGFAIFVIDHDQGKEPSRLSWPPEADPEDPTTWGSLLLLPG